MIPPHVRNKIAERLNVEVGVRDDVGRFVFRFAALESNRDVEYALYELENSHDATFSKAIHIVLEEISNHNINELNKRFPSDEAEARAIIHAYTHGFPPPYEPWHHIDNASGDLLREIIKQLIVKINEPNTERIIKDIKLRTLSVDTHRGPAHGEILSVRELETEPEYVELTGDDIPYHLRADAEPLAICDRCHRETYNPEIVFTVDTMTQPDGKGCGGIFKPKPAFTGFTTIKDLPTGDFRAKPLGQITTVDKDENGDLQITGTLNENGKKWMEKYGPEK